MQFGGFNLNFFLRFFGSLFFTFYFILFFILYLYFEMSCNDLNDSLSYSLARQALSLQDQLVLIKNSWDPLSPSCVFKVGITVFYPQIHYRLICYEYSGIYL